MNQVRKPPAKILPPEEVVKMKEAFKQTDAIFALEGFAPTEQTHAIRAALLAGRATHAQVADEMLAYAMEHKTTEGFIQTRTWALTGSGSGT
jgi:hypothetical protein